MKKTRKPTPLRTHHEDVQLLQRVHARYLPRFAQLVRIKRILSPVERRILVANVVILLGASAWLAVLILGQHREKVPAVGGRYVEAVIGSPQLVNPVFAPLNDPDMDIARLVYSGLMRYDDKQRLVPDLAASYSVSADKKTYTFHLRRDVRWHDGEPFTARDVIFTMGIVQNPAVGSPLFVTFQGVDAHMRDEYTVELTLKEPFAPFLGSLTVGVLPEHIWNGVPPERMRLHRNNLQPIGTGPFQFSKLLKDDTGYIYQYELVRNDRYYRTPAYLETFVFHFFGEFEGPAGAIQAIREQRVNGLSFVPHDLREQVARKHITLHTLQLPQYTALFLHQDANSALKFKEVRHALEMALEKERILRGAVGGEGTVIWGPLLPGYPGYTEDVAKTPYVVDEANTLLDAVSTRITAEEYRAARRAEILKDLESVSSTASGLEHPTSTERDAEVDRRLAEEIHEAQIFYRKLNNGILSLTLVTADTGEYRRAAELIAGFWQDVGVKTTIRRIAPKEMPREALRGRNYDVLLYSVIIGGDPDQYPFWHSSQTDFPGLNLSRYVNRTVDGLLIKAREASTAEEAATLSKKFQEQILLDRPAIFLYTPTYTYATNDKIFGITATRIFHPADRLNGASSWYMKTKWQWQKT